MSKILPDSHDIMVWSLTETTGVYRNTGTQSPNNALTDLSVTNTVIRTATGNFTDNCLFLPGVENFPTGSSATRNYVAGANTITPSAPFTISGWILLRAVNTIDSGTIIGKAYRDPTITSSWANPFFAINIILLTTNSGQDWRVTIALTSSTTVNFDVTDFPIPIGQWSHIGVTYDGAAMRVYLNGCQCIYYSGASQLNTVAAASIAYTDGVNGFGPWIFGAIAATGSAAKSEANYMIQDVRIANVVRPLSYFKNIYKVGALPLNLSALVKYYKLRAYDISCASPTFVTWVDTQVSLANAPTFPCSGPYSSPEVISTWLA